MEIDCVEECGGPEGDWETGAVQEGTGLDCEFVIHNLGGLVLGSAVGTCGFNNRVEGFDELAECRVPIKNLVMNAQRMLMGDSLVCVRNTQIWHEALSTMRRYEL